MIITLCGSARFEPWFHAWNEALSLAGNCVFGLASYPSQHDGEKNWYTAEEKRRLDEVHKLKIERSDAILVLNVFAYLGESTLGEIAHARKLGRTTYFLESWGKGNGITTAHFGHVQEARDKFGVPRGCGSPIDTSCCSDRPGPWDPDLMGEGGPVRSAIVKRLRERLDHFAHGWGAH